MHIQFRKYLSFAPLLLILFAFSACKSKLNPFKKENSYFTEKTNTQVLSDALSSQLEYKTITTKGSLELVFGNSSKKFSTIYTIYKDSILQASVRPLVGIETHRASFTPDSIIIIDRLKKQYVAERFDEFELSQSVEFNFYNLQSILTNQIFLPGKKQVVKSDFDKYEITPLEDSYLLKVSDKNNFAYDFTLNATNHVTITSMSNSKQGLELKWSYRDFVIDGKYVYPTTISGNFSGMKLNATLNINYSKLEIDKELQINNSIPNKYRKVTFKELMSSYTK